MIQSARNLTAAEIAVASEYFARQVAQSRVRVVETDRVPRSRVIGLVYAVVPGAGEEPLGTRLMEFAPDAQRHELRDAAICLPHTKGHNTFRRPMTARRQASRLPA